MARFEDAQYYLVDNAPAEGPPIWVHEGEIERCFVAALPVTGAMRSSHDVQQ